MLPTYKNWKADKLFLKLGLVSQEFRIHRDT